jgi:hypothetical protein
MEIKVDKKRVPSKHWMWNQTKNGFESVSTSKGKLAWLFTKEKPKHSVIRKTQSFINFLKNGPKNQDVPVDVLLEIYQLVIDAMVEGK